MSPEQSNQDKPSIGAPGCLGIVVYVVAGILALATLLVFVVSDPEQPECDGDPMSPGDICDTVHSDGEVTSRSYDEALDDLRDGERNRENARLPLLGATIVSLVVATVLMTAGVRRKRATRQQPPPFVGTPPGPPGT